MAELVTTVKRDILRLPQQKDVTCTVAVVCWMWCVHFNSTNQKGRATPNVLQDNGKANGEEGNFFDFIDHGQGAYSKRTDVFLKKLATDKGSHIGWKKGHMFRQGCLVLWTKTGSNVCVHAGVNGGNNRIFGYNQNGKYYNPDCTTHTEPFHYKHTGQGRHCQRRTQDINTTGYNVYTVGPNNAMTYFEDHKYDLTYW